MLNSERLYSMWRYLLFRCAPEAAHILGLSSIQAVHRLGLLSGIGEQYALPCRVMGLDFPNPIGLAAGLDKDGQYITALSDLGFGFIEVGTVTPYAQPGNPKPRLFRLVSDQALVNRMGFNNQGVVALVSRLKHFKQLRSPTILGVNIGKNRSTPMHEASHDYITALRAVYAYADYITINVSSPNTKNLRQLQCADRLYALLSTLLTERTQLQKTHSRFVPFVLKISPDLERDTLSAVAEIANKIAIDGIIATNTTVQRGVGLRSAYASEGGGLSGRPLFSQTNRVIRTLRSYLKDTIPIIAVGGIMSAEDALAHCDAGASLVQIYTGFIYRGPVLVREIAHAMRSRLTINR